MQHRYVKPVRALFAAVFPAVVAIASVSMAQQRPSGAQTVQPAIAGVVQTMNDVERDLQSLNNSHQAYRENAEKITALYSDLSRKTEAVTRAAGAARTTRTDAANNALQAAIRNLQETQMKFDMQFLQLQAAMQDENRKYTTISNVMKTKHDTVKNSISNVR